MLCDESHDMLIAYKAWGLKKFMGREYMGIFIITYVIDENGKTNRRIKIVFTNN